MRVACCANWKRLQVFWLVLLFFGVGGLLLAAPCHPATGDELKQEKTCARKLYRSKERMKYRDQWMRCIRGFESYYRRHPRERQADEALYALGKLYERLYGYSWRRSDLDTALSRYREVIKEFPNSRFADDAQYRLGKIYLEYEKDADRAYVEFLKVVVRFPHGDMKPRAEARLAELEAETGRKRSKLPVPIVPELPTTPLPLMAKVTDIRHWSAPDYTRVVIDVDEQVSYSSHLLRADPELGTPPRLYVDLKSARMAPSLEEMIPIRDGLLRKVRTGHFKPGVVRVVLDIESIERHKIFSLSDPFRIVVDVTGQEERESSPPGTVENKNFTLAQQLGLGVKRVVIDPGHGGKDPGAMGSRLREKDVVLAISRKLREKLERELKLEVILTRNSDVFLPLEERTALANTKKADLFVSIHTNAHRNRRLHGVSTYILNVATDAEAARVAALENATSTKRISDLEKILNDLMLNAKINESTRLAHLVQQGLVEKLRAKYDKVKDLGVRQAPFYVLIGAQMPCLLVETSFISNSREAARLATPAYQDAVAEGIAKGIDSYIKQVEELAK